MAELHARRRTTTLLVTHDYEEALALAERVAVMHAGRLLQTGTPEDVYRRPCSARVAALTGAVSAVAGRREGEHVVLPWGRWRAEFAADARDAVVALLRPEDVRVASGNGATLRSARFRAGAWLAAVEAGGQALLGLAERRPAPGAAVALELREPVWCTAE